MGYATKAEIAASKDWDTDELDVRGWGTVRIRSMSAQERLDLSSWADERENDGNEATVDFVCRLLAMTLIDGSGQLLFDPDCAEDIAILRSRSFARLKDVADRVMKFNGMDSEENEEAAKN